MILWVSESTQAQIGLINDADGYTNVRAQPGTNGEVIFQIKDGEVFWYDWETDESVTWVSVYVPKNDFTFGCDASQNVIGYIHKSRLVSLMSLDRYTGNDVKINMTTMPFDKKNHFVTTDSIYGMTDIDGMQFWGCDRALPIDEVKDMSISFKGKEIKIHPIFYSDIYDCYDEFTVYEREGLYYFHQGNGSGENYYEIVWVVSENGLVQRLLGAPY